MVLDTKHVKGPERKLKYVCKNWYFTQTALEVHGRPGFATSVKRFSRHDFRVMIFYSYTKGSKLECAFEVLVA